MAATAPMMSCNMATCENENKRLRTPNKGADLEEECQPLVIRDGRVTVLIHSLEGCGLVIRGLERRGQAHTQLVGGRYGEHLAKLVLAHGTVPISISGLLGLF